MCDDSVLSRENINKGFLSIKMKQMEILKVKSTIISMKNSLKGLNSTIQLEDERISRPKDRSDINYVIKKGFKMKQNEQIFRKIRTSVSAPT